MTAPLTIIDFLEKHYIIEGGRLFVCEPWQREFLTRLYERDGAGRRRYSLALLEIPKKNGKTTLAAGVALYELILGVPEGEIYFLANSREQASDLSFNKTKKAVQRHPEIRKWCKVYAERIINTKNGTIAQVLPCSPGAVAGRNPSLVIADELWALPDEDCWYELTESPARKEPLALIVTYPGHDFTSLLYRIHQQGEAGTDPRMLHYYRPYLRSSWITDAYLESQRRRLPPHVYQRLHEALWVAGSNAAWTRQQVEAALDPLLFPKELGTPGRPHFCGLDVGLRRDRTAAAVVSWANSNRLELDDLKVWTPKKGQQVLVSDVEGWLDVAWRRFPRLHIHADPSLFEGSIQKARGGIVEERFTAELVRRLSMNLFELIAGGTLRLFEQEEMVSELLTVNIRTTSYGWRIDHESGQHDDICMALGLACLAAMEHRPGLHKPKLITAGVHNLGEGLISEHDFAQSNGGFGKVHINRGGIFDII